MADPDNDVCCFRLNFLIHQFFVLFFLLQLITHSCPKWPISGVASTLGIDHLTFDGGGGGKGGMGDLVRVRIFSPALIWRQVFSPCI